MKKLTAILMTLCLLFGACAAVADLIPPEWDSMPHVVLEDDDTTISEASYEGEWVLNVAFLIIGMFMEALAVMTITVPFLIPLMGSFGIDPVHLGVVLVLNLMIGLCTPPVGTSLFICAKTANIRIEEMYKAVLPFLIPLVVVLLLITYVPAFVTWLPGVFS